MFLRLPILDYPHMSLYYATLIYLYYITLTSFILPSPVLFSSCRDKGDDIFLWFDLFSNNQHDAPNCDFIWWSTTFKTAIEQFGHTVLILSPWLVSFIFFSYITFHIYMIISLCVPLCIYLFLLTLDHI